MNKMARVRYLSSYLSKSSGFQKYSICWVFWHFVCVFVFVVVFVIVFVFVFVSSYDFWIAFIISFQNMYGYRGLWSLRAEIMVIFEVMTDRHTHTQTPNPLIDSAYPVGWAEWKHKNMSKYMQKYSIIIFKSKIDIRKKSLYQEKELGENAEARSHLCSAASKQLCFECIFLQKFNF